MPVQNKVTQEKKQNTPKPKVMNQTGLAGGVATLLDESIPQAALAPDSQASLLGDARLQSAQKLALANRISSQHGNQHLQRLVMSLKQYKNPESKVESDPSHSKNGNGHKPIIQTSSPG
jgi:hypothetical protein